MESKIIYPVGYKEEAAKVEDRKAIVAANKAAAVSIVNTVAASKPVDYKTVISAIVGVLPLRIDEAEAIVEEVDKARFPAKFEAKAVEGEVIK